MKWYGAIALAAVACKSPSQPAKHEKHGPIPIAAPPPVAVPVPAPVKPAGIDLLHAVPARVAVSSAVANAAYTPFDLADGDVTTAWNSRTGDMHAWIAFRVPAAAHVDRVRMTVGFTATGPEGDYFTMNPRIRRVRVTHAGAAPREVALDPESRELQDIAIDGNGGDYRIDVIDTVAGSRKDWREVCVSELQVIGTPPPGTKPADELELAIGSLDGDPLDDKSLDLTPLPPGLVVPDTKPADPPALPASWPAGWSGAHWVESDGECVLAITAGAKTSMLDVGEGRCGKHYGQFGELERYEIAMHDGWLVVVTAPGYDRLPERAVTITEQLMVCGSHDGAPACIAPIMIGQRDYSEGGAGEPGADGLEVRDDVKWEFRYKIAGDVLTISKDKGNPDAMYLDALGRHRLKR